MSKRRATKKPTKKAARKPARTAAGRFAKKATKKTAKKPAAKGRTGLRQPSAADRRRAQLFDILDRWKQRKKVTANEKSILTRFHVALFKTGVTQDCIATLTGGRKRQQISRWEAEGAPRMDDGSKAGRYNPGKFIGAVIDLLNARARSPAGRERTLKEENLELRNEELKDEQRKRRGALVEASKVEKAWQDDGAKIRKRVMAVASATAPHLADKSAREIEVQLRGALTAALEDLAEGQSYG